MPPNRCSDERLLRLSHGEPGWIERLATRLHLTRCGDCRRRQAELESLAHVLRRETPEEMLTPARVDAARQRFHERVAGDNPIGVRRSGARAAMAVAASLSCMLAAGVGIWRYERASGPAVVRAPIAAPVATTVKVAMSPRARAVEPVPVHLPEPAVTLPPATASADVEVALLLVLHEQGLCRQGSVELNREPETGLVIRGVVTSRADAESLRDKLEQAADGQPVLIDLRSADEASATVPAVAASVTTPAAEPLGNDLLRDHLQARKLEAGERIHEANRISNDAVRLAGAMAMEAWALRRLDDRARSLADAVLSPESSAYLRAMRTAHLDALQQALSAEQDLLGPIVGVGTAEPAADIAAIAGLAELLQDTFAAPRKAGQSVDAVREDLRDGLAGALAAVQQRRR